MCTIISSGPCQCGTSAGSSIPGPLEALAAILRAAWWLTVHLVAPVTVAVLVWLSGARILPRPRRYRRYVHAAGRMALVAALVAALMWPVTTGVALVVLGLGLAVTATVTRDRHRRAARPAPAGPIRVTARVRRPAAAVTDHPAGPASTWSTSSTRSGVRRG